MLAKCFSNLMPAQLRHCYLTNVRSGGLRVQCTKRQSSYSYAHDVTKTKHFKNSQSFKRRRPLIFHFTSNTVSACAHRNSQESVGSCWRNAQMLFAKPALSWTISKLSPKKHRRSTAYWWNESSRPNATWSSRPWRWKTEKTTNKTNDAINNTRWLVLQCLSCFLTNVLWRCVAHQLVCYTFHFNRNWLHSLTIEPEHMTSDPTSIESIHHREPTNKKEDDYFICTSSEPFSFFSLFTYSCKRYQVDRSHC